MTLIDKEIEISIKPTDKVERIKGKRVVEMEEIPSQQQRLSSSIEQDL